MQYTLYQNYCGHDDLFAGINFISVAALLCTPNFAVLERWHLV